MLQVHSFALLIGDSHIALFAALGFVSVLAGATNTPIAATIMAVELFGIEMAHYAALSVVISFLITGHRSVFTSQILAMRKSEMLVVKVGSEIDGADVNLEDYELSKIKNIRDKLQKRRKSLQQRRLENRKNKKP